MSMEEADASQGAPEGEPVAQPDIPAEGTGKPADQAPAEPTEETPPEPEKPKPRPWFMDRIDRQGQRIAEQQRQLEEYQRREREGGERESPKGDDVERRVAAALAQREQQGRLDKFDGEGRKEFPDFLERCNTVANCGAADRPEFMHIISEMDDGHKVVAHLADHPDEALRILSLTPARMALELGKLSGKGVAPAPAPKSAAPPPIKPLSGSGKVETDPEKMSVSEWMRWRDKQS